MTLNTNPKPYGLSDVKLTSISGLLQVDLPASTKLTFKERIKSAEGVGDDMLDVVVAVREGLEWELEATGLPLEALVRNAPQVQDGQFRVPKILDPDQAG